MHTAIRAGKRFSICEPKRRTAKKPEAPSIRRASGFLIICAWNGLPGQPHRAPPALPPLLQKYSKRGIAEHLRLPINDGQLCFADWVT